MQKTKEQNYELFYNTIKSLSYSQGKYGRLLKEIDNLDECNRQDLIGQLPDFKDTIDTILFIEQWYQMII